MVFFIQFGGVFGLSLILAPISYLIGVWFLLRALNALSEDGYISNGTTLHSYVRESYDSLVLSRITASISVLGYIGILIIEIHVGVNVFGLYTSESSLLQIIAISLAALMGLYTWIGGYKAVVGTDKYQLLLIGGATFAAIVGLLYLLTNSTSPFPGNLLVPKPWELPLSMIIVFLFGNIPLQILRMSNWQRIAAVGEVLAVKRGLSQAIIFTFVFWALFNLIGVLFSATSSSQEAFPAVGLLNTLGAIPDPYGAIVVSLVFVGMVAALLSTGDSILIPIVTSLVYDFGFHHKKVTYTDQMAGDENVRDALSDARKAIVVVVVLTIALYGLLVWVANFDFVSLLFVFFNQQLVLFPAVILAMDPNKTGLKSLTKIISVAIGIGWILVWACTYLGVLLNNQDLVFYAAAIGFACATLIPTISSRYRVGFRRSMSRILSG
ncbi:MAG: hypothetical protein AB2776_19000 [Candidatus Thiodiazotropha endolucinida]